MSRQLEIAREERQRKETDALVRALEYGLESGLRAGGFDLQGFSVRCGGADALVTIRARKEGEYFVAFAGGESATSALGKAGREAEGGKLVWRESKF